jgi:FdhD protein
LWLRSRAERPDQVLPTRIYRFLPTGLTATLDDIAIEEPLEIRVGARHLAVLMRTPGDDVALTAGFLASEGLIRSPADVISIDHGVDRDGFPSDNLVVVRLRPELERDEALVARPFTVSSACGVCGAAQVEAILRELSPLDAGWSISPRVLLGLEETLRSAQSGFRRTGGLHATGLFDLTGNLVTMSEDVGRHNAFDKVVGERLLLGQLPLHRYLVLVSGRASFELVQKAASAGLPLLASVGAPSSLAVELALAAGLTLVGLLRRDRFAVYAGPERVESDRATL